MKRKVLELGLLNLILFNSGLLIITGDLRALPVFVISGLLAIVKGFKFAKAIGAFGIKYMDPEYFEKED